MSLDKEVKEKDELRDMNSQPKYHTVTGKPVCAWNETVNSCSQRAQVTDKQMQNRPLLNYKLYSQPLRALVGKEWNPASWNVDMWEDADEAGETEPLNSVESSLSVEKPPHLQWK